MLVAGQHNLLLLDEPTNNLDPPSRAAIGAALRTWKGAMVLVSHDTEFVTELEPDRVLRDARRHRRPLVGRPRGARRPRVVFGASPRGGLMTRSARMVVVVRDRGAGDAGRRVRQRDREERAAVTSATTTAPAAARRPPTCPASAPASPPTQIKLGVTLDRLQVHPRATSTRSTSNQETGVQATSSTTSTSNGGINGRKIVPVYKYDLPAPAGGRGRRVHVAHRGRPGVRGDRQHVRPDRRRAAVHRQAAQDAC